MLSDDLKALISPYLNPKGWKYPTKAAHVATLSDAIKMRDAFSYFMGGAEMIKTATGYTVKSKGYYHYIGA